MTDGLRADFGSDSECMPNIHAFLKKYGGYKFTEAYAPATWTLAIMMAFYTGLLPSNNGLDDITYCFDADRIRKKYGENFWQASKCNDSDLLMAKLRKRGYTTKLFINATSHQFDATAHHLFDKKICWDYTFFQMNKISGEKITKPFFYYTKDNDGGHSPYGALPRNKREDWDKISGIPYNEHDAMKDTDTFPQSKLYKLCEVQAQQYDLKLKLFLEWFVEQKLYRDTCVIITSDHGDALREHKWVGHAVHCYEEIIHIPLYFYHPDVESYKEVNDPVSLIDLTPTILEMEKYGDGVNLFHHSSERIIFFELTRLDDPFKEEKKLRFSMEDFIKDVFWRGLRYRNHKFMYIRGKDNRNRTELYDFSNSREEKPETLCHDAELEQRYLNILKKKFGGLE